MAYLTSDLKPDRIPVSRTGEETKTVGCQVAGQVRHSNLIEDTTCRHRTQHKRVPSRICTIDRRTPRSGDRASGGGRRHRGVPIQQVERLVDDVERTTAEASTRGGQPACSRICGQCGQCGQWGQCCPNPSQTRCQCSSQFQYIQSYLYVECLRR